MTCAGVVKCQWDGATFNCRYGLSVVLEVGIYPYYTDLPSCCPGEAQASYSQHRAWQPKVEKTPSAPMRTKPFLQIHSVSTPTTRCAPCSKCILKLGCCPISEVMLHTPIPAQVSCLSEKFVLTVKRWHSASFTRAVSTLLHSPS